MNVFVLTLPGIAAIYLFGPELIYEVETPTQQILSLIIRTMIRTEDLQLNSSYVRPCTFYIPEVCPLVCVKVLVRAQKKSAN